VKVSLAGKFAVWIETVVSVTTPVMVKVGMTKGGREVAVGPGVGEGPGVGVGPVTGTSPVVLFQNQL
jgi:hypothetical protein